LDNQSWIFAHAYVVENWKRILVLLNLEWVVNGTTSDNLIIAIVCFVNQLVDMLGIDIANKVVCFGANSETIFQGLKENVIVQLVNSHNPYIIGIFHCMAHCRNPSFGFATKTKVCKVASQ
jgi:hypothetical protein